MSTVKDTELVDSVDKILQKSQDDVRRKLLALISKREKAAVKLALTGLKSKKENKAPSKAPRKRKEVEPPHDSRRETEDSNSD